MTPVEDRSEAGPARHRSAGARALFVMLVVLGHVLAPGAASAGTPPKSVGVVLYDAVVERPVGLVETLVGTGVTLVAYPLALGSGRTDQVLERCIQAPARYTFTRALGDFSGQPHNDCGAIGLGWGAIRASIAVAERPIGFLFGRSPLDRAPPSAPLEELEI